jgi:gliding motility-associated-like protein
MKKNLFLVCLVSVFNLGILSPLFAQDWTIRNIAGNGNDIFVPDVNPLLSGFNKPNAMAADTSGNIYFIVTAQNRIYRIKDGILEIFYEETVIGNFLNGLAIDSHNNVFFTFSQTGPPGDGNRQYFIWKKTQDELTDAFLIAGNGDAGFPPLMGDHASDYPIGKAAGLKINKEPDGSGGFTEYLYYSGNGESQSFIQKIDLTNDSHPTFRVAGTNESAPAEITEGVQALDFSVNVGLGFAWDSAGNLYYGTNNDRINRINASDQTIHFFAGNSTAGYIEDNIDAKLTSLDLSTSGFLITNINGVEAMLICDSENNRVRKIVLATEAGQPNIITTICGTGFDEGTVGQAAGDLTGSNVKLGEETNLKPFDIVQIGNEYYISDNAKRIRKMFLCKNPTIEEIEVIEDVFCIGDTIILKVDGDINQAGQWNWFEEECGNIVTSFSHQPTIEIIVDKGKTYTVNATGGCATRDVCTEITISPNCKEFYNTFSPNGDGKNDFMEINTVQNYPTNVVSIFNRWGSLVKEIQNYDNLTNVWNGTDLSNDYVASGTYFFSFESGGEVIISGWVQIIR